MDYSKMTQPMHTEVWDTYWKFAAERQKIMYQRAAGDSPPWTEDPILQKYKFTNCYRASDRVSQYLIKNVIYIYLRGDTWLEQPSEVFFRIILFKWFNKIETWELLCKELGETPTFMDFSLTVYDKILEKALQRGQPIFSNAYMMTSGTEIYGYKRKHKNSLSIIKEMMNKCLPETILGAKTMGEVYNLILPYGMVGEFLAYQYTTDINYSLLTNFSENDFTVLGPGSKSGIKKCFFNLGDYKPVDIIKWAVDTQEEQFALRDLDWDGLWGRRLHCIDIQSLFCEVDKYSRVALPFYKGLGNRTKIKTTYKKPKEKLQHYYPPKWNINHLIGKGVK